MKNTILIIFSLFLIKCSTQNIKNDLLKFNIKGKVKSAKILQNKAVKIKGEIQKREIQNLNGSYSVDNYLLFNKQGMIVENKQYISGELIHKHTFKYDSNLNLLKKNDYNSNGKLGSIIKYESTLNSKNELIEQKGLINERSREKIIIQKIFENQNIVKEISYLDYSNKEIFEIKEYFYNKKGNLIQENRKSNKGIIWLKTLYYHNEKGEIEQIKIYNSTNELISNENYKCIKFDKYNNCTKKIVYENNEPKNIIETEFEYY